VIVIAATNRPDVLDPALVRPGRFDRQVALDAPDIGGRLDILKVHVKGKPLAEDTNLEAIAKVTPGASGADLANIVNEAAILAARRGKQRIGMLELEDATERLMLGGPERRSRVMTPEEKRLTAYHEAGHAIVAAAMPKADPVHKVTIVPRGQAGGYTLFLPAGDQRYRTEQQFEAMMAYGLGARHGDALRHERYAWPNPTGRRARDDLPGPGERGTTQLFGGDGAADRRRGQATRRDGAPVRHDDRATEHRCTPRAGARAIGGRDDWG
jgi:cell division protease FtsH